MLKALNNSQLDCKVLVNRWHVDVDYRFLPVMNHIYMQQLCDYRNTSVHSME